METKPDDLMKMASFAITSLEGSQASAAEKAAALKVAAFAIEQASTAQHVAIAMANLLKTIDGRQK